MAKALMFLGTSSESGKSIMAAAFCRILKRRGVSVAPFKAQNMALNSGVTPDGREMGRAQIVQAEAAGIEPHVDMNPVLLKPTSEKGCQVILQGVVRGNMDALDYHQEKKSLWPVVTESYDRLSKDYELIILEGAGSPVEINLKENDIVNMAMAEYSDAAAILVADIDRGGVFASIIGTMDLLEKNERQRLMGFIINKFRGDVTLLSNGLEFIKEKTSRPVLGVVPYVHDLYLPREDSVFLEGKCFPALKKNAIVSVGIIRLPHISNYTDFDSLEFDPRFMVEYVQSSGSLKRFDVVIIPGSKNVFFDFRFIVERNLKEEIIAYYKSGGKIAGICGGFQMIGKSIKDPHGIEGNEKEIATLGLLPVNSVLDKIKVTERIKRNVKLPCQDKTIQVECYEIHMGKTTLLEKRSGQYSSNNFKTDQSITATDDGRVWGTYMHGIFDNDELRDCFIKWVKGADYSVPTVDFSFIKFKEMNYERLADIVEENVDVPAILKRTGINI